MDQAPISQSTSSQPAKQPTKFPKLDNAELIKTGFWVGHLLMIMATIAGVYLAAQEGLSQAIQFDQLTDKQNNYHLRHALHDELSDNVDIINDYAELVITKNPYNIKDFHPAMALFIWENMKYSTYTLETPSEILSSTRRFYLQSEAIINKIEKKFYGARFGGEELKKITQKIQSETLPALKSNYQQLAEELQLAGMAVN